MKALDLNEVYSLTEFQRDAKTHISRLKKSRRPVVLTVNGRAEIVVQDAKSYQELLDALEHLENLAAIQQGLADAKEGKGVPAREFLEKMRKKYKIPAQR